MHNINQDKINEGMLYLMGFKSPQIERLKDIKSKIKKYKEV